MTLGEKYINKKIIAKQIIAYFMFIVLLFCSFIMGHILTVKKLGETSFTETKTVEAPINWENPFTENKTVKAPINWENPYKELIKDEIAFFIIEKCKSLEFDPKLLLAILLQENPSQNPRAINKNNNGTMDRGLFQLNSFYQPYFTENYWPFDKHNTDMNFDWSNWQHNSWVAIHLIKDLYEDFDKDIEKTIMAYNAGASAVISGNIPKTTLDYRDKVLNNYKLLSSK